MSKNQKFLSLAAASILLSFSLISCGDSNQPGQGASHQETAEAEIVSENCSFGIIVEYDGSPAGATRMDALENMGKILTDHLTQTPATQDPTTVNDQLKDPIRLASGIRGIETLKEILPSVEETRKPSDPIEVTATTNDGQQLASATISVQYDGTYVVEALNATGFQSDGPHCK